METLEQAWPLPSAPRSIVFVGAGAIVGAAHVPAYRSAGLTIAGCYDSDPLASRALDDEHGVGQVFDSLAAAVADRDMVIDIAVPAGQILSVLEAVPDGATVLIQKPMGRDLAEAKHIRELSAAKRLIAAVNHQLRFSPNMLALRDALGRGLLGQPIDIELRVVTHTPWEQWGFLAGIPRMEIVYHSIHYLDLIRSLFGEPDEVKCVAAPHPALPAYADVRASVLLRYESGLRASLYTYHAHAWGAEHAASELRVEGLEGAALARMGVNLDYPRGEPDMLRLVRRGGSWMDVPLVGSWFPTAFAGTMANLQRFAAGEDEVLLTGVDDVLRTMALVEACYLANEVRGTAVPEVDGDG